MNKQEIERAIEGIRRYRDSSTLVGLCKETYDAAISALQQQLTGGWIPVSSGRLPEEWKDEHGISIAFFVTVRDIGRPFKVCYDGKEWFDLFTREVYRNVTAWMPLPEPWKEERE